MVGPPWSSWRPLQIVRFAGLEPRRCRRLNTRRCDKRSDVAGQRGDVVELVDVLPARLAGGRQSMNRLKSPLNLRRRSSSVCAEQRAPAPASMII